MTTTWMLFECPGGSRWSSVHEDYHGRICNFSGCNCRGLAQRAGTTTDRHVAHEWFRRPDDPLAVEYRAARAHLVHEASLAEEQFGLDELERFALQRAKATAPKPITFDNNAQSRQGKLFAGADCLPGQGELFNPNGPREEKDP